MTSATSPANAIRLACLFIDSASLMTRRRPPERDRFIKGRHRRNNSDRAPWVRRGCRGALTGRSHPPPKNHIGKKLLTSTR